MFFRWISSSVQKPKKILNLCYHKTDFGFQAEWHFYATSHGKGPCDGIGGTVKCLAAKASLQRTYNSQIMTPRQLFNWAVQNIERVHFKYCTIDDYRREEVFLEERLELFLYVTQKLHCFIPLSNTKILTKTFSNSSVAKEERATHLHKTEIPIDEIKGFVTAMYEDNWWLGCVCSVPYMYFIPYAYGIYHTHMVYTIRVWYVPYAYGTILYTIRVRYDHTHMVRTIRV